jgi:cytochrome c553
MSRAVRVTRLPESLSAGVPVASGRQRVLVCVLSGLCALACALSGCERRVSPTREWRPTDHGQPAQGDPSRTPPPSEPEEGGTDRAADALFSVSCASCHGRDGRGLGDGRPPGATMPDFTAKEFQAQRSDAQLRELIRNGRGLMPGFGKQLNDSGLDALVARVRRFAPSK